MQEGLIRTNDNKGVISITAINWIHSKLKEHKNLHKWDKDKEAGVVKAKEEAATGFSHVKVIEFKSLTISISVNDSTIFVSMHLYI